MVKKLFILAVLLYNVTLLKAQPANCTFKPPFITIHFGTGEIRDLNPGFLANYDRRETTCPRDGYYSYASYTSECFSGDWHTITEDHTPGDVEGNMMLVNGAPDPGTFLKTSVSGFKGNTTYEFGVWLMNLCRPTEKCPFPLLANLTIRLETQEGKVIAQIRTGDLIRTELPHWTQHRAQFTTPASATALILTMIDNAPGGCGNDFVLDDITFRECVKTPPIVKTASKKTEVKTQPVTQKATAKPVVKKPTTAPPEKEARVSKVVKPEVDTVSKSINVLQPNRQVALKPPPVLTSRVNELAKRIEVEASDIKIDLYDNGTIDNDTVSIYHNNQLIVSRARLSDKAITFRVSVDAAQPHHELVMVAENLGSIPPNTSLMIITAGTARYEVRISSTEQKNAKVVFDLKR